MASRTVNLRIKVGVYDDAALHAEAVKAYMGGDTSEQKLADALDCLGTVDDPNIANCLVELWAEFCPAAAGYEFHTYEGEDA